MYIPRQARLLPALLCLSFASCGDDVGFTLPVEGKVTLNGTPLKQGTVVFWPDESKGNKMAHTASSQIGPDGTYALYTKGREGAPVGAYKVTVISEALGDSTDPGKTKLLVPRKFTNRDTTTRLIEVVEDPRENAYDLTLK